MPITGSVTSNRIHSIKDSMEWNAWHADQLAARASEEVTRICREWAASKRHDLCRMVKSRTISKGLIKEILQNLVTDEDRKQISERIIQSLASDLAECDVHFMPPIDLNLNFRRFEKYWFEINNTSLAADLTEEIRQNCWSMVLGAFPGWVLEQAVSKNRYRLQQWDLKALLIKQIEGTLLFIEQRLSSQLRQDIILKIYHTFDQREADLIQTFYGCYDDLLIEEILHQVS